MFLNLSCISDLISWSRKRVSALAAPLWANMSLLDKRRRLHRDRIARPAVARRPGLLPLATRRQLAEIEPADTPWALGDTSYPLSLASLSPKLTEPGFVKNRSQAWCDRSFDKVVADDRDALDDLIAQQTCEHVLGNGVCTTHLQPDEIQEIGSHRTLEIVHHGCIAN